MLHALLLALGCLYARAASGVACQLPSDWRPLSESCRAELAQIIVYARVLSVRPEPRGGSALYNYLPYDDGAAALGLLYAAEIELLCDQAWGSMLEVPAGSRLTLTGLGYFSCQSHTVVQNSSYIFFLRMDENYHILPHAVNFQDAIFPDTLENRRIFSSLFQFSNCSHSQGLETFSPDWEIQEDSRLALFEEEEQVRKLQERMAKLERRNRQLKEQLRKVKRSLRQARRNARRQHANAIQQDGAPCRALRGV
ncbi:coiled-coil domain-containing protein 3-like [Arapaima gigas]